MKRSCAALLLCLATTPAWAGPWTLDEGSFYLNASYSRIRTRSLFAPNFKVVPILPYEQHVVGIYGEFGIIKRWLTGSVSGIPYRMSRIDGEGGVQGVGDWRVGLATGLLVRPVHLSFQLTLGIPSGDAAPSAGPHADAEAQQIARTLPTGDGEWDVEARLSLGHSFGEVRRWPVKHYVVAEVGYWLRTQFSDSFVWRLEFGTQFPYKFIDRFWFIWRFTGVESFATAEEAGQSATGLGNGVSFLSPGITVYGRIHGGLGASVGFDSALRARSLPAGSQVMCSIIYRR